MIQADMLSEFKRLVAVATLAALAALAAQRAEVFLLVRHLDQTRKLSATDLARLPRRTIDVTDEERRGTYEGVRLIDVLTHAGVTFGQTLRGGRLATYLLASATDGYRVVFALPEIDPEFARHDILVADRRDGQPLPSRDGPLQLVVLADKRHARWVRGLTSLTIAAAPEVK
jgi:hypothetical protein